MQRDKDEQTRWEHYRTVPAKHYKEMSGRDARVLIDQQQRWGIPCAGKVVDLAAVIKSFHDFIASHIHRPLDAPDGGEPAHRSAGTSPGTGQYPRRPPTMPRVP